jgi:hypothetical protein
VERTERNLEDPDKRKMLQPFKDAYNFSAAGDAIAAIKSELLSLPQESLPKYKMLTLNPTVCGLFIHFIDSVWHYEYLASTNPTRWITACAHLYNTAFHAEGCLDQV